MPERLLGDYEVRPKAMIETVYARLELPRFTDLRIQVDITVHLV